MEQGQRNPSLSEFSQAVQVYLDAVHPAMQPRLISPGEIVLQLQNGQVAIWRLANLYHRFCRGPQRATRLHSMIEQTLDQLGQPISLSPDEILFHVLPRIVPLPIQMSFVLPSQYLPGNVAAIPAVDLPDCILYPTTKQLMYFQISPDQLWQHAYQNLSERVFPSPRWLMDLGMWIFEGDVFTPSLALTPWRLQQYCNRLSKPVLVGFPDCETLVLTGGNDIRLPFIRSLIRNYYREHHNGLMSDLFPLSSFDILSPYAGPGKQE